MIAGFSRNRETVSPSMSSPSPTKLVLPGPEGWVHYRRVNRQAEWTMLGPKESRVIDADTWVAVPSLHFDYLWARLPEGTAPERQEMLKLEMESRGWQPDGRDQGRTVALMVPDAGHVVCSAACWPGQPSLDEFARAGWFTPSAWAYGYRPYSVTIWMEAGALTAVWTGAVANFPVHCQSLSRVTLDRDLAAELDTVETSLRLSGVPVRTAVLVFRGEIGDPSSRHSLARMLGWTDAIEQLAPQDPGFETSGTILPPAAGEYRRRARSQSRVRGFALFAVAVMGVGAFFMVQPAVSKQRELQARTEALDQIEPELSGLREAREIWNLLQPALNPQRYPQELLLRCVKEVPAEGVRVTQFECTQNSVMLAGEASTPQLAIQFQNRLQQNVSLGGAVWDAPSPGFQEDGRASFQIQATFQDVPEQP
jgi:hypothetical protein